VGDCAATAACPRSNATGKRPAFTPDVSIRGAMCTSMAGSSSLKSTAQASGCIALSLHRVSVEFSTRSARASLREMPPLAHELPCQVQIAVAACGVSVTRCLTGADVDESGRWQGCPPTLRCFSSGHKLEKHVWFDTHLLC